MLKSFNKETNERKIKYKIDFSSENHAHLYKMSFKKKFFGSSAFNEEIELIYYDKREDNFSFCNDISAEVFNDIKQVLEAIPFKFKIEIKDGKIPSEYGMLKELEKEDEYKDENEDKNNWI